MNKFSQALLVILLGGGSLCEGVPLTLRIMPLGDSITQGCCSGSPYPGGYRSKLYELLTLGGASVNYIGTLSDPPNNGGLPDRDHQGYPGATIEILRNNIDGVFTKVPTPDLILLDIGTNNFWNGDQPIAVCIALTALIDQVAAQCPTSKILVSNLLLRTDVHAALQEQFGRDYLPALISDEIARGHHVSLANLHAALLGSDLTADHVHPTVNGYNKMAVAWYEAVKDATGGLLIDPLEMVINGGFESIASESSGAHNNGPYSVEGWVTSGTPFELMTSWNPVLSTTEGSKIAFFNGGDDSYDGSISQSFATVPGTIYQLSFDAGIVVSESWAPRQQTMGVEVIGSKELFHMDINILGGEGKAQWRPQKFYFTADSSNTTLVFRDKSRVLTSPTAQYSDLLLDNVRLIVSPNDPSLVAFPQAITIKTGQPFRMNLSGVLGQTTQPENIMISTLPSHGLLSSAGDDITYTAVSGYTGGDSFSFMITNGTMHSAAAIVSINVIPLDAPTLINGSFETGSLIGGTDGHRNLDGWQVSGTPIGLGTSWNTRLSATDGERVAFFNPGSDAFGGIISQTFATIKGAAYRLTFDAGVVVSETWAPRQQKLLVQVLGNSPILSNTVFLNGLEGAANWTSANFEFVADGNSTTLMFTDRSADLVEPTANLSDMILDNVKILPKPNILTYDEWLAYHSFPTGVLEDHDGDGILDIVEYVIGGDPKACNDQRFRPVGRIVIGDPDGSEQYLLFQYRRTLSSAADPTIHIKVEYATDLIGQWNDADSNPLVKSVLSYEPLQDGSDLVSYYLPLTLGVRGKLFARLVVSRP